MADVWDLAPAVNKPQGVWDLAPVVGESVPTPSEVRSISDAVIYGLQSSATGLAARRDLPEQQLPADTPWYHRIPAGAASMAADLPLSIVAAVPGFVGGGAVGTAVPVVGTAAGAIVGAGATGFGVPMAIRDALMTAYSQNQARTWEDVWQIAKSGALGFGKGAVIGGATLGAGRVVGGAMATSGAVARGAAVTGAEIGTMTGTAAALEGRLPEAHEFLDNAVLLFGLKGAVAGASRLRQIYAETGKAPAEVRADAEADPALRAELMGPPKPELVGPVKPAAEELLSTPERLLPEAYRELALNARVEAAISADPRLDIIQRHMQAVLKGEKPLLDTAAPESAVRWEYAVDGESATALVRATAQLFKGEFDKQKRGIVTDKATLDEAMDILRKAYTESTGLDPHVIGEAENAPMMAARTLAVHESAKIAVEKAKEVAQKSDAELTVKDKVELLAAMERFQLVSQDRAGASAEIARALHIMRTLKYDREAVAVAEQLTSLMQKNWGNYKFQDIAAMMARMDDPAQIAKFSKDVAKATTSEQILEAWKATILSGPLTLEANLLGNVGKFAVDMVVEAPAKASIEAVRRAFTNDPMTLVEFKAKALSPLIGLKLGMHDALVVAGEIIKGAGDHLEKADVFRHALPGRVGHWARLPFRVLQATDALFRVPAERARAHELAVIRALKDGFVPETKEFNERVMQYTHRPDFGLTPEAAEKALAEVQQAGAEAVYAQRLGKRMEQIQMAMAGSLPAGLVMPFVRTPVNLLSWATQHSPFFLLSKRWRDDFMAGGERRDAAIGRVVVGTMLSWAAYEAFDEEILTGGGHFLTPQERATKVAAGWQPYSFKPFKEYYSYQRLEPIAKVIGLVGDIMEMHKRADKDDQFKLMAGAVALFGNATVSTTYLSGLANMFKAVTDPARYADTWFEGYVSSLVPKIIGQTAQIIDPYKREVDGVVDALQSQIPYIREKLMPQRDVWGEKKPNTRLFSVLPIATSKESHDKVKSEAMRLELGISDVPKFIRLPGPLKPGQQKLELTGEERDVLRAVSGRVAMEILSPLVNSPDWKGLPDYAQIDAYKKALKDARAIGTLEALPPDSKRPAEAREKIINEMNRQLEAAGQ